MQAAYVPNSLCPLPAVCPARVTHEDAAALSWSPSLNVSVSSSPPPGTHNLNLPASDVSEKPSHTVRYPHVWLRKRQGGELCCCSFLEFDFLLPPGDNKLHVNVFVPSGSDESDCTPGTLFVCQSECAYFCATVGIVGPPAIAVIPITVVCVKGKRECVSYQHAVSHHWTWGWWAVYICHISQSLAVICVI